MLDAVFLVEFWPGVGAGLHGQQRFAQLRRLGMPESAGQLVGVTQRHPVLTLGHLLWMALAMGSMSKHTIWSCAWLTTQAICSGCIRGLWCATPDLSR